MAPKAHHIHKVPQNWDHTVEQLFAAAFDQSEAIYRYASLCGWRPLASDDEPLHPLLADYTYNDTLQPAENGPGVVIMESSNGFTIEIEVPQIKEDSLYLEVSGDTLIIRGERIQPDTSESLNTNGSGPSSLFQRFVQLPVLVQPGQVRARLMGTTIRVDIKK